VAQEVVCFLLISSTIFHKEVRNMPSIFWTGTLSLPMKVLVNSSNMIAWVSGNARDTKAMKKRVKLGYEGAFSDHVTRYDEVGQGHFTKVSLVLLKDIVVQGKEVLDVGSGTGILSIIVLEKGAKKVICGDASEYMLAQCKAKAAKLGYGPERIDFRQLDAEALPYDDNSFDVALSSMVIGFIPEPNKMISEMTRVVRPGGIVAISAQGTDFYKEAIDAAMRSLNKLYVLGYRIEFWPRKEIEIQELFAQANLADIKMRRVTWQDDFASGGKAWDFFSSTGAAWWYGKFPADKVAAEAQKSRNFFERKKVTRITQDVILAYGRKR
jgi:ubiquinone/menaquinone biosynthesis C-methylase UbiE